MMISGDWLGVFEGPAKKQKSQGLIQKSLLWLRSGCRQVMQLWWLELQLTMDSQLIWISFNPHFHWGLHPAGWPDNMYVCSKLTKKRDRGIRSFGSVSPPCSQPAGQVEIYSCDGWRRVHSWWGGSPRQETRTAPELHTLPGSAVPSKSTTVKITWNYQFFTETVENQKVQFLCNDFHFAGDKCWWRESGSQGQLLLGLPTDTDVL